MTELAPLDATYVAARRVLLDALLALAAHDRAVIVAGAQAIYLRTGSADLSITVAPFTTDGDLALDPRSLGDDPEMEAAMTGANFELRPQEERPHRAGDPDRRRLGWRAMFRDTH
jgi:hypothetical protein